MDVYFDTSVVVSLIVKDVRTPKAIAWFERTAPTPIVSNLVKLEFAATVSRYFRSQQLSEIDADRIFAFFDNWSSEKTQCVNVVAEDIDRATRIFRIFATKLAGPDAIHLAIAARSGVPIVTFDQRLAAAARMQTVEAIVPT